MAVPLIGLGITALGLSGLVRAVLRALSVVFVSFAGGTAFLTGVKLFVQTQVNLLDADIIKLLGVLGFDEAVNILIYGLSLRLVISGVKKMRFL